MIKKILFPILESRIFFHIICIGKIIPDNVFSCEQDCKPGYVVDDHLSRAAVTDSLKRPT